MMRTLSALLIAAGMAWAQSGKSWTAPRTPDGQPDIQGVWSTATTTPLERPAEFSGKATLTPAEAAEFQKKAIYDVNGDRRDGGGAADVGRAYNEFWRERGSVVPDLRTSLISDPPDGKIPPLTPEARKRQADRATAARGHEFDGPENRSLQERCLLSTNAGPPMTPANYSANYQIVQGPGWVVLVNEMIHDARTIPLDGRPHVDPSIRQWMGDARGHWEGNTLVVETTNFTDKTAFRGSSEEMRLVERFTRTGPETLLYEFTVDDPATFGKPWTAKIPTTRVEGAMYEYACHEGNYGMEGILTGARAQEGKHVSR